MHRKCIRDSLCAFSAIIKREPEEDEEEQTNAAENRRATLQAVFADV